MPHYEVGSPSDPMLGRQVEGYRIVNLVGKGGMGVVYEAVHEGIGQRAAVKVLFPEFSTDVDAVSRFVAEARAASKVRHGGLVKIFYDGRLDDGTAYIMMEFLAGESLEERCRRLDREGKRLDPGAVLRMGQQIASALSAVHREGIVHRDLKPANLILVSDPEIAGGERIKVVDFGIAKFDHSTTEISKTTVGRFLGTALYASPEQCQMAGNVGPEADVYSLGVILYQLLAGKPPFQADQPGIIIGMHLFLQPQPLWEVAPSVPESLHLLVHQMLDKAPARRPSMDKVSVGLAGVKLESPRLLWRLRRDKRLLAAAAGGLVLAGAGTLWRLARVDAAPPSATPVVVAPAVLSVPPADLAGVAPKDLGEREDLSAPAADMHGRPRSEPDAAAPPIDPGVLRGAKRRRAAKPIAASSAKPTGPAELPSARPPAATAAPPAAPPPPEPASRPLEPKPAEKKDAKPEPRDDGIIR